MKRLIKYSILILFLSVYVAASGCTVKAVGDPDRPITINAHITLDVKGLEDTATDIEDFVSGEKPKEKLTVGKGE